MTSNCITESPVALTCRVSPLDDDLVKHIECALLTFLPQCRPDTAGVLNNALRSAVFPGGKRLRPSLTILAAGVFGAQDERVMRAACAVEFVHTSSLIIDDLPCMDDANLRRGHPALHRVYGEGVALLTGIALLNQAYALFGQNPELTHEATECIGVTGMIAGQAIDLGPVPGGAALVERDRKTSAMMRLAFTAGALAAGASRNAIAPLAAAGHLLGEAYQICDDLLDAGNAKTETGKTINQDLRHNRPSHSRHSDAAACCANAFGMMEKARRCLLESYGESDRISRLLVFIDRIFESATDIFSRSGGKGETSPL